MGDVERRLAKKLDELFMEAMMDGTVRPRTALRVRGNIFETVELDDAGNVIEPRRCWGISLHAPNCKTCDI